jgi:ketosteroid isomerase-like protein
MEDDMARTMDELIDEAAIKEVQVRYCRAADRVDFEALRACFHPDATADYGHGVWSLDEYMAHAREMTAKFIATTHNTGNQLVEVAGDVAWAEHYTVATHRRPFDEQGETSDMIASVRYIDKMERRSGRWRIARRMMVLDWHRVEPVSGVDVSMAGGRRDRSDPSYLR